MGAVESKYTITLDDDPMVHRLITKVTGVQSLPFAHPDALLNQSQRLQPIAAFIDIFLGFDEATGLDIIPHLNRVWPYTPIFVITAQELDRYVGQALAVGAKDFIKKPFSYEELKARFYIRIEEAAQIKENFQFQLGDVDFDSNSRELVGKKNRSYLSPFASSILVCLIRANGTMVSRDVLKRRVWGSLKVNDNCVDRRLSEIRRGLKDVGADLTVKSKYGKGVVLENELEMRNKIAL